MNNINPWGNDIIKDYGKLIKDFDIQPLSEIEYENPNIFMRRGIDFGHRDLDKWLEDAKKHKAAILTGIKPSGVYHLGNLITAQKLVYFQKQYNVPAFYAIADIEAFEDNGIPFDKGFKNAIDNVADLLALGLDKNKAYIYLQSENKKVMKLSYLAAKKTTNATLKAIYGERPVGLYMCALTQIGDILLPQDDEFGGPKRVLVPVGIDQDPHIRLARDVAQKYNLIPPASIYHKLFKSLDGTKKMSKRDPMGYISINDNEKVLKEKIMKSYTGGKDTIKKQKEEGGDADICPIFDLAKFFFVQDDKQLKSLYEKCTSGSILCGECKMEIYKEAAKFLKEHQSKKERLKVDAEKILNQSKS